MGLKLHPSRSQITTEKSKLYFLYFFLNSLLTFKGIWSMCYIKWLYWEEIVNEESTTQIVIIISKQIKNQVLTQGNSEF